MVGGTVGDGKEGEEKTRREDGRGDGVVIGRGRDGEGQRTSEDRRRPAGETGEGGVKVFLKLSAQKHDRLIISSNFQSKRLPGGLFFCFCFWLTL